jgi:hypothetical protein
VAISPEGQTLVERVRQGRRERLAAAVEAMDDESRAALVKGLEALAGAADHIDAGELRAELRQEELAPDRR